MIAATARYPATVLGVWQALSEVLAGLRAVGVPVPTVWPMYVIRLRNGRYGARTWLGNKPRTRVELPATFSTPEAAHLAFVRHLAGRAVAG